VTGQWRAFPMAAADSGAYEGSAGRARDRNFLYSGCAARFTSMCCSALVESWNLTIPAGCYSSDPQLLGSNRLRALRSPNSRSVTHPWTFRLDLRTLREVDLYQELS